MSTAGPIGAAIAIRGSGQALAAAATKDASPFDLAPVRVAIAASPGAAAGAELREARSAADRRDVAFLVEDDVELAEALSADGVEIGWSPESFATARKAMGGGRTVGCRVGLVRHDAMLAAEAGADYVALGAGTADDEAFERLVEMTAWWAEIFEVACLAMGARSAGEAARLAAAGADFVDVPPDLWGLAPGSFLAVLTAQTRPFP